MRTLALALGLTAVGSMARAQQDIPLKEWTVPWDKQGISRDAFPDGRGNVWFVGQRGNYVARLDTKTGEFKRYEIDPGTNPHNLTVNAKGEVWLTGNANGTLVKLDPVSGKRTVIKMPDPAIKDPHTLTWDRNGDAWFTAQTGNVVGKLTAATNAIRLWPMPTPGARPYGVVLDSKGRPFFDEFGTNKIGTIDPKTGALREYKLPSDSTRPRRIAITSDDIIWYGDYTRGFLGRLDPATGKVEEFRMPSRGLSLPYGMATDDRDHIWVAETGVQPNRLVEFDPRTRTFVSNTPIPSSSPNTVRHMVFERATHQLWFADDAGRVTRATVGAVGIVP
jgi:virginiamycin B lyase